MDIGAVVAAIVGAFGGGAATAVGGLARNRGSARTAARLIYAELTRGGAAVAYFRMSGTWPTGTLPLTAWEQHGRSLAQLRRSRAFDSVHRGYAALEAVQYLASGVDVADSQRHDLLDHAIGELIEAFRAIGEVAHIPHARVDAEVGRLLGATPASGLAGRPLALPGVVPPLLLNRLIDHGATTSRPSPRAGRPAGRRERPKPADKVDVLIYDARHAEVLDVEDMTLVRRTGDPPSGDRDADDAYDALMSTLRFAREVLGRRAIDDASPRIRAVVHYGTDYDNAFWNGEMLFLGDGDGVVFQRFAACPEIVAHEAFHALPGIGVSFRGQSGALTESLCDVFGVLVAQYALGQTAAEASWISGEGLLGPDITGVGLHSLRAPGTAYDDATLGRDPQVAHMDDYVETTVDNGGIHINGGIPSRAFYLLASALGGHAWERAGMIWYDAVLAGGPMRRVDFPLFARRTIRAAERRHGKDSREAAETRAAWDAVGVRPGR